MVFLNFLSPLKIGRIDSTYKFSARAKIATLWIVIIIVALFLLRFLRLLPVFIWAAVTAYLFTPLITFLSRKSRLPKVLWVIILYVVLGAAVFFFLKAFYPIFSFEISDLVNGSLDDPTSFVGRIASQGDFSLLGFNISLKDQLIVLINWLKIQIPLQFVPIFFGAIEKLIFLVVYLVITFYLILDTDKYIILLKKVIPLPYRQEIFSLLESVNLTLGAYIRAQVVLIFIMGIVSFIVLSVLKIRYALVLSLVTGILEVIPIVGPIFATTIATTVALFQASTPFGLSNITLAIIVIIAYFGLRQLEDYFIIPNVVSKFVNVHPVIAIFALMVGGSIAGVLGLFLAIPTAAIIIVLSTYLYKKLTED